MIDIYILKLKLNLKMDTYHLGSLTLDRQKKKGCRSVFSLSSYLYSAVTLIHLRFDLLKSQVKKRKKKLFYLINIKVINRVKHVKIKFFCMCDKF
jgi:hypothetical protein